jgi:hypothetical protein
MTTINQIHYVAGILEGEGSFLVYGYSPTIRLAMTDKDIVVRVRDIISPERLVHDYKNKRTNHKIVYIFTSHSTEAIQWMMTLYPLMGERRKEQIRAVLAAWKNSRHHNKQNGRCKDNHPLEIRGRDFRYDNNENIVCLHCKREDSKLRSAGLKNVSNF